jgi:hypothetical protein
MKSYDISIEDLIYERNYEYTCEVGCLYGRTSNLILEKSNNIKVHYMVDPWKQYNTIGQDNSKDKPLLNYNQENWEDTYKKCCNTMSKYGNRCKIIRAISADGVKSVDSLLDCVIVDADHTTKPFLVDIVTWLPKIKDDGMWISHDYGGGWVDVVDCCNKVFTKNNINKIRRTYIFVELNKSLKEEFINRAKEILNDLD